MSDDTQPNGFSRAHYHNSNAVIAGSQRSFAGGLRDGSSVMLGDRSLVHGASSSHYNDVDKENVHQTDDCAGAPSKGAAAESAALKPQLSEYIKDRQPARSILRKAPVQEDSAWQKLQSKFSSLEGELLSFSTQAQTRRESLTGRPELKGTALVNNAQPAHQNQPSLRSIVEEAELPSHSHSRLTAAAAAAVVALAAPREAVVASTQPSATTQPQQQTLAAPPASLAYDRFDPHSSQDDDACTAALGAAIGSSSREHIVSLPAGAPSSSKVVKLASEIFEDQGLKKLVTDVLHKQLQRTKDGATDKSRIHELAELVKQLRKCVKEMGSRATSYIDQCTKLERDWGQQVEAGKLSSQTSQKQLEAELASTRQSLAECERDFRNDKAKWGLQLETQAAEMSRLHRELERLTEERDRARDEVKRSEQHRQQLEAELKELRKVSSQQLREVSMSQANQSEAVRVLMEDKIMLEKKLDGLREENSRISKTMSALQECNVVYEHEIQLLNASRDNLQASLKAKEAAAVAQSEQLAKLHKELAACRDELSALAAEEQRLQQELARGEEQRAELNTSLMQREAEGRDLRERLAEREQEAAEHLEAWEEERKALQDSIAALQASLAQKEQTFDVLRQALTKTMAEKEALEAMAEQEAVEKAAMQRERSNLLNQVEFAAGCQAQAEQAASELRSELSAIEEQLRAARAELGAKDERLVHLEGEFEALKEVLGETSAAAGGSGLGADGKDVVACLLSKISTLQNSAAAAEAVRRKLHNELVDLRGNIRVYCRVRPHATPSTRVSADGTSIALAVDGKEHCFGYDRVFGADSTQEGVFNAVSELVQSALDGFHVCIFSYGQTGAGKTHTMQGGESPTSRGIIPRSVEKILATAHKLQEQAEWSYSMEASFIEIYNNQLRDLLGTCPAAASYISDQHAIKHDPDGGHTIVAGVSKVPVTDAEGAAQLVLRAAANRAVDSTAMNSVSSRSHSVFMLYISGWHAGTGTRLQGCLCLVDLAGSERLDRSLAEGQAKKEACAINQSLSALGDVFSALSAKSSHVPYRNSKLTYLLQPCLGGSGKTLMFVNINPEPASAGESLCSLRFAAKVSGCETGARGGARRNVMTLAGSGDAGPSMAADASGEGRRTRASAPGAVQTAVAAGKSTGTAQQAAAGAMPPPRGPTFHVGQVPPGTASRRPGAQGKIPPPKTVSAPAPRSGAAGTRRPASASAAVRPTGGGASAAAAGPSAAKPGVRLSMPGLPRPPGAAGLSDAAVKRMSLAGPARQAATRAAGMGVGQKRQAGAMGMTGGNLAKRTKS